MEEVAKAELLRATHEAVLAVKAEQARLEEETAQETSRSEAREGTQEAQRDAQQEAAEDKSGLGCDRGGAPEQPPATQVEDTAEEQAVEMPVAVAQTSPGREDKEVDKKSFWQQQDKEREQSEQARRNKLLNSLGPRGGPLQGQRYRGTGVQGGVQAYRGTGVAM